MNFRYILEKKKTVVKFTLGKWLHKVHTRTKTKTDFVFTLPGDTNVSCMFTKTETDKYYLSGIWMYHCRIHQTCTEWYILSILSRNPVSKIFLNESCLFLSFFACFCFYFALKILRHLQQTCDLLSETNVKFLCDLIGRNTSVHVYAFMFTYPAHTLIWSVDLVIMQAPLPLLFKFYWLCRAVGVWHSVRPGNFVCP